MAALNDSRPTTPGFSAGVELSTLLAAGPTSKVLHNIMFPTSTQLLTPSQPMDTPESDLTDEVSVKGRFRASSSGVTSATPLTETLLTPDRSAIESILQTPLQSIVESSIDHVVDENWTPRRASVAVVTPATSTAFSSRISYCGSSTGHRNSYTDNHTYDSSSSAADSTLLSGRRRCSGDGAFSSGFRREELRNGGSGGGIGGFLSSNPPTPSKLDATTWTCAECGGYFDGVGRQPKLLACIHTFCEPCLLRRQIPVASGSFGQPPTLAGSGTEELLSSAATAPLVSVTCPLDRCHQMTLAASVASLHTNIAALTLSLVLRTLQPAHDRPANCDCCGTMGNSGRTSPVASSTSTRSTKPTGSSTSEDSGLVTKDETDSLSLGTVDSSSEATNLATQICLVCHQLVCDECATVQHPATATIPPPIGHILVNLEDVIGGSSYSSTGSWSESARRLIDRLRAARQAALLAQNAVLSGAQCPHHPARPVITYCETCSKPACEQCMSGHVSRTRDDGSVCVHVLKGFDLATFRHERGYFRSYIKVLRSSMRDLSQSVEDLVQRLPNAQHGFGGDDDELESATPSSDGASTPTAATMATAAATAAAFDAVEAKLMGVYERNYVDQAGEAARAEQESLRKVSNEVGQVMEECERLVALFGNALNNCSAVELSTLREWIWLKLCGIRKRAQRLTGAASNIWNKGRRSSLPAEFLSGTINHEFAKAARSTIGVIGENSSFEQWNSGRRASSAAISAHMSQLNNSTHGAFAASSDGADSFGWPSSTYSAMSQSSQQLGPQQGQKVHSMMGNGMQSSRGHHLTSAPLRSTVSASRPVSNSPHLPPSPRTSISSISAGSTGSLSRSSSIDVKSMSISGGDENSQLSLMGEPSSMGSMVPRVQLSYVAKIGQFGEGDGQFTEPSGIAVNRANQLVVADTNNHRVQVFSAHGSYLWRFGECGKRAGQVLYPNRIAIGPDEEFVFTERAPQCLVQVFNKTGVFLRRFGSTDLKHPRGVCVDKEGRILVLECQVMAVTIYSMEGVKLHRFCFDIVKFPSAICVNDKHEIFISDNNTHAIYVYSYGGEYKRRIGGLPLINFPVGVAINHLGQLVVADNHNNFNITVFTQEGIPLFGFESRVKHAQVLDVCLLNGGKAVAISCKDYRVYVYPYATDDGLLDSMQTAYSVSPPSNPPPLLGPMAHHNALTPRALNDSANLSLM